MLLAAVGAWILAWVATPGAELRWMDVERSTVTVYVSAPGAAAAAHVIEAPLAEGSVEDTESPHMALVINVDQLRVVDPGAVGRGAPAGPGRRCWGPKGSRRSGTPGSPTTR